MFLEISGIRAFRRVLRTHDRLRADEMRKFPFSSSVTTYEISEY